MPRRHLITAALFVIAALAGSWWAAYALPSDRGPTFAAAATAVATVVLAALTGFLLQLNADTVAEMRNATAATQRATEATQAAALATERDARATEESSRTLREQIEREWRPLLVLRDEPNLRAVQEFGDNQVNVQLVNLGRGPAVNVLVCLWNEAEDEVWRSGPVHVGAGGTTNLTVFRLEDKRNDMFDFNPPRSHQAIICEDQSGGWHRFSRNDPVPDSYSGPGSPLDSWAAFYSVVLNRLPPR